MQHTIPPLTRRAVLRRSLEHWHREVRAAGRRGDRHATQRAVRNVQHLQRRLGLPLSYEVQA